LSVRVEDFPAVRGIILLMIATHDCRPQRPL